MPGRTRHHILQACHTTWSSAATHAQYVNRQYRRTGSLWESRHRASLVQSGRHLLACYRYIKLNPVRATMVARPQEYPWSSHGENAWGISEWIQPHPV